MPTMSGRSCRSSVSACFQVVRLRLASFESNPATRSAALIQPRPTGIIFAK